MHICKDAINRQAIRRNLLRYPKRPSEFEIQAYLWARMRKLGYDVRGEVPTRRMKARFDLVIFEDRKPVRIIEVKCVVRSWKAGTRSGNQRATYQNDYGIPVDAVGGLSEARKYLERLIETNPPKNPDAPTLH